MPKYLLILLLISAVHTNAQQNERKTDFRFGSGISLLGTGDMITVNFENEVNFTLSPHISNSFSINYGRSNWGVYETASFVQANANLYVAPFGNTKRNVFRIGTGLSYYNVSDADKIEGLCGVGQPVEETSFFDTRNALGYNLIIENTYAITGRFLIGLKLFTQPYMNGDINSGMMLKAGIEL